MTSSKLITSYKIERQARHEFAAQSCTKSRIKKIKEAKIIDIQIQDEKAITLGNRHF